MSLTIFNITAERTSGFSVSVTLERVIDATGYKIYRDGILISDQEGLTYTDTINYGIHEYTYEGYNTNLTSNRATSTYIRYGKGTLLVT